MFVVIGPQADGLYHLGCYEGATFYIMDRFTSYALALAIADKMNAQPTQEK